MSEDHAVPPSAAERRRLQARVRTAVPILLFAGVVVLWLLLELGGEAVHEALGILALIVFAIWVISGPRRAWRVLRGNRGGKARRQDSRNRSK